MYKIGIVEDDLMMQAMIIERLSRLNKEESTKIEILPIEFDDLSVEALVDVVYGENFDALIIDQNLKSTNTQITYEGTDIALEIERIIHFFPVFILTSFDLSAESNINTDVNKVYKKEKYIEDDAGDFVDHVNRKIFQQIYNYKERLRLADEKRSKLMRKAYLSPEERDDLLYLDHLIEKSVSGRNHLPLTLKNNDEKLKEIIDMFNKYIVEER